MARKRADMGNLRSTLAALLGGVAGVLASKLLERFGVKPMVAAGGVALLGGAIAAFSEHEDLQAAGGGVAAAATSCLVQLWFESGLLARPERAEAKPREQASAGNVNAAFDAALASLRADQQQRQAA
jgi:hypothetical protein